MYQAEIHQIIHNSIFLHELLDDVNFEVNSNNAREFNQRLERWCQVVAQGNWETFENRLQWSGWSIERVKQILSSEIVIDNFLLPDWAVTIADIIKNFPKLSFKEIDLSPIQLNEPLPFEDVLLPLVLIARRRLLARLNVHSLSPNCLPLTILTESAYSNLERELLRRLLNVASKTLDFEFSRTRSVGENLLNLVLEKKQGTASQAKYKAFTQKLLSDNLLGFFQEYPVLARSLATIVNFWVEAVGEFLERLECDLREIQACFRLENVNQLGKLIQAETGVSDPHNHGRAVIILIFESGFKVVYKPKALKLETIFNQLLEHCNSYLKQSSEEKNAGSIDFKTLTILNRDNYGWIEYIDQKSCCSESEAQRFYIRAGMLLCLLYVLGATDCHSENLIANGEYPVLIDLETVMHHQVKPSEGNSENPAALIAANQLLDSVLRTGLLPFWEFRPGSSTAYDYSAFGNVNAQLTREPVPVWKFINTDDMRQGYEIATIPPQLNVPTLNGITLSPNSYLQELGDGFKQMYHLLIEHRSDLLKTDSPLAAFCSAQVRFIFRPTRVYAKLLQRTIEPKFLRNGIDWSIELDILSRSFLTTQTKPQNWKILAAEIESLGQFDFPYFLANVNSDDLVLEPDKSIKSFFTASSYDQALFRLNSLNENDLELQTRIIQLVFYSKVARTREINPSVVSLVNQKFQADVDFTPEQLVQQANDIATKIQQQVINGTDGSATWIGLTLVTSVERFQLQPLGASLYDGFLGTALFLAAFEFVKRDTQFRDLALKAILPIRQVLSNSNKEYANEFAQDLGIGGATGIGSIIYSFTKISKFFDMPELCQEALRASELLSPELVASDQKFDVVGGAAGAVLSLLALYSQTKQSEVLKRAIACGQHLLSYCQSAYSGGTAKRERSKPLTGFSHGAAGIAYSLIKLYAATQDYSYLESACQAIAYERSVFSPSRRNWPIISSVTGASETPIFWSTWCYGAPGIGLGRVAGLSIYKTEEVSADIDIALETTQKTPLQEIDHLCCGNLGRAEVLLVASQKMSKPHWHQEAKKLVAAVIQRSHETGGYQLFSELPTPVFNPCFFQGTAGIGYQLLRLAYPSSLPSILLWE